MASPEAVKNRNSTSQSSTEGISTDDNMVSSIMETKTEDEPEEFAETDASKGKKRSAVKQGGFKSQKKFFRYQQPKNALMQLNELKPGLRYTFESQEGRPHEPIFQVSVVVNDQKFIGKGNSKQLAKHAAAEAALSSFVQFQNMPEAMHAMSKHILNSDFTADNIETECSIFNKFEQSQSTNGSNASIALQNKLTSKLQKVYTEADKKNPVMLLNELLPGLTYSLVRENTSIPSQRFVMSVAVNGEVFEGVGQNKKTAKAAAARSVLFKQYKINFNLYSSSSPDYSLNPEADTFNFPQATADKIAKCISDTFNDIMVSNPEFAKWKVLSGIAMTKDEALENIQIIGIGTGTKHLNGEHMSMNGAALNDCHAEIISRRCLRDFFYTQLELHVEGDGNQSIFEKKGPKFHLKPHIQFHLFISTSPCGDARIFAVHEEEDDSVDRHPNRKARGLLRTKIESGEGTIPVTSHCIQTWDGILQGQQRYLTMACSDKIASWNVLGLQGSLLTHFIEPVYLNSIILGRLFHRNHIYRAVCGRLEGSLEKLPECFRLNKPKLCTTTSLETRQLVKSPNFSINWTFGLGRPEVVIAKTGKLESGQTSRLAKRSFFQRFSYLYNVLLPQNQVAPHPHQYSSVKKSAKDYKEAKEQLQKAFALVELGHWVKKPAEQDLFELIY